METKGTSDSSYFMNREPYRIYRYVNFKWKKLTLPMYNSQIENSLGFLNMYKRFKGNEGTTPSH